MVISRTFYSIFIVLFFFDFGVKNNTIILGFILPVLGAAIYRYMDTYTDIDFMEKENLSNLAKMRNFLNREKIDDHSSCIDSGILRNHMGKCKQTTCMCHKIWENIVVYKDVVKSEMYIQMKPQKFISQEIEYFVIERFVSSNKRNMQAKFMMI